jgi:hypothetical protein
MKQRYYLSKGKEGRITPPPEPQGEIESHAHNDEIVEDDESKAQIRKLRKIAYKGGFPRLYHITTKDTATKILAEGFRDGESAQPLFAGVWLSNTPLDGNEGAYGDTVLMVQFRVHLRRLSRFVVIEERKNYREWVLRATYIARHATTTMSRLIPKSLGSDLRSSLTLVPGAISSSVAVVLMPHRHPSARSPANRS